MTCNRKSILIFFTILCLLQSAYTQSPAPVPYCHSKPLYQVLPMVVGEIIQGDLSYAFSGYNLDIAVDAHDNFNATIPQKLKLLGKSNMQLSGLQSHFLQRNGNNWGQHFHMLSDQFGMTILYIASLASTDSLPEIKLTIIVEFRENTDCFDAAVFWQENIAIVDCVDRVKINGTQKLVNKFMFVDLEKQKTIKEVENQFYVEFKQVTRRSMFKYTDPSTQFNYLVRSYFADGVDRDHAANTYLELFSAIDVNNIEIIRVFDRSTVQQNQMTIMDVKLYLGDIFLVDYFHGLYWLDILSNQHIQITGFYEIEFFTKVSVYSNALDEKLLIALANTHAVQQIIWDYHNAPIVDTKYALPMHSHVRDLYINEKFLVVQSSANTTNQLGDYTVLNYTWIFTKGSRTFVNAYKVIDHKASDVLIDLNAQQNKLLLIDQTGIMNYQLNQAKITLRQLDFAMEGKSVDIKMTATSTDYYSKEKKVCVENLRIYFVKPDNFSMWQTGITTPESFYSNSPGRLEIFLQDFVIGPNITLSAQQTMLHKDLPPHWVLQQNQTFINFDQAPAPGDITFFYSEAVPYYGDDVIIYFYQDSQNVTHVTYCEHRWESLFINCKVQAQYAHNSKIDQFSTAVTFKGGKFGYYYVYTFQRFPNYVYIIDFINHKLYATIQFPEGFQGRVGSIASSNGIIYLTLPFVKTINAYALEGCLDGKCPLTFSLNSQTLKPLGVDYFAPVELVTTRHHPEVLFIKNRGSVLVLDVDNDNNIVLLNQVVSQAVVDYDYRLAVNQFYLTIISAPSTIQQYNIEEIYYKKITPFKNILLYNYVIPADFDLEFSDFGDLFYINVNDPTTNNATSVLVYRMGTFAVSSLYDVINLPGHFQHSNLEIEVSGYFVDYVSIIATGKFYVFRQYELPILVVTNPTQDFQFYIHYSNHESSQNLSLVSVKVANPPSNFTPAQNFEKTIKSLKLTDQGHYTWDARTWFTGHILRYNASCEECGHKIHLKNHIHYMASQNMASKDYAQTFLGGISLSDDLVRLHINGSISNIMLLPDQDQTQTCVRISATLDDMLIVSACQLTGGGVNLYLTSTVSSKPFTYGPFFTGARYCRNVQLANHLVAIVDVDYFPQFMFRQGAVFIYAMNIDPVTAQQFDEIDVIDSNDLIAAHGWQNDDAFLANAHLMYDRQDDSFRLYLTQLWNGLFVLDFKHREGSRQLNILTVNYIDMNKLLVDNNFHMPNGAFYLAVTHVSVQYNPVFEVENILVTTSGYHNFQISIIYDPNGHILSTVLHRVYYRYGGYNTINYVKSTDGFVAIGYIVPPTQKFNTQQIIAVYDSKDYSGDSAKGYSQRYMLGGHTLNHTIPSVFGFNLTMDHTDERIGLVVIDTMSNRMTESSVSRNLSLQIQGHFKSQPLTLTPYNDYFNYTFDIQIIGNTPADGLGRWAIIFIVVSTLLSAGFIAYVVFLCWRRKKLLQAEQPLLQEETVNQTPEEGVRVNQSLAYSENRTTLMNQLEQSHRTQQQTGNKQVSGDEQQQEVEEKRESLVDPPIAIEQQ